MNQWQEQLALRDGKKENLSVCQVTPFHKLQAQDVAINRK
jgi:hypothetical protein